MHAFLLQPPPIATGGAETPPRAALEHDGVVVGKRLVKSELARGDAIHGRLVVGSVDACRHGDAEVVEGARGHLLHLELNAVDHALAAIAVVAHRIVIRGCAHLREGRLRVVVALLPVRVRAGELLDRVVSGLKLLPKVKRLVARGGRIHSEREARVVIRAPDLREVGEHADAVFNAGRERERVPADSELHGHVLAREERVHVGRLAERHVGRGGGTARLREEALDRLILVVNELSHRRVVGLGEARSWNQVAR
mmetsp:Transcript_37399/g.101271  ORF Transcript_37399/g.101271 Transcript_37399/m.101271 type:complete len:254 (+) Transcript_37399:7263-8024(+)